MKSHTQLIESITTVSNAVREAKTKNSSPKVYVNRYYCADCDEAWIDTWDCRCDSECPQCHTDYTPFDTKREWLKAQKKARTK